MIKFKDLPLGGSFKFDKGVESGLLSDMGTAGSQVFQKVSSKRYRSGGESFVIGSVNAKVWEAENR